MIEKIEHIGIAVKNLDEANKIYEQLLGTPPYKMETVDSEGVNTSFFKTGESKVELLQATEEESAITKFIAKKGDVLFWHARLMHRGSLPKNPGIDRKTAIVHYSGVNHRPDFPEAKQYINQGWFFDPKRWQDSAVSFHHGSRPPDRLRERGQSDHP